MTINELYDKLRDKRKIQKYNDLLTALKGAKTQQEAQTIWNNSRIIIKNGNLFGGRKTKKQKGGFTYKSLIIRKRIPYSSKTYKRSKSSKSSKRSFR
jgi:hypothetical protein